MNENIEIILYNLRKKNNNNKLVFFGASSLLKNKWERLKKLNILPDIICDNDINKIGKYFENFKIASPDKLLSSSDSFNILITSSFVIEIKEQLKIFKNINLIYDINDIFNKNYGDVSNEFIYYKKNVLLNTKLKTIAFYLPQFHPFPENDEWWGKGFTEWTNVTKAKPNFLGHYQPHLPIHNGFYDLRIPDIMIEQAKLAKNYGIYGFNFYYYWFDGKILMHKPFEILLKYKEIDINFCITWANENWTRRWDGLDNEILIAQNHSEKDSIKFIHSLFKYFKDERYIRINNKPILIIYRSNIIPHIKKISKIWRKEAKKEGFDGLYLICAQTSGTYTPHDISFDAAMEFPPHRMDDGKQLLEELNIINPHFEGKIFDYNTVTKKAIEKDEPEFKLFRTSTLSWDNTARKQNKSTIYTNFSLDSYKDWMYHLYKSTLDNDKLNDDEKLVFVNAWNEWAEGTHLEPDRKFGYGYLQATYDSLSKAIVDNTVIKIFDSIPKYGNLNQVDENKFKNLQNNLFIELSKPFIKDIKIISYKLINNKTRSIIINKDFLTTIYDNIKLAIIVLHYKYLEDTKRVINSILNQKNIEYELFIVSNDESYHNFIELSIMYPNLNIIQSPQNLGYAGGNNIAIDIAFKKNIKNILIVNPDLELEKEDVLEKMYTFSENNPDVSIFGPRIMYGDRKDIVWFNGAVVELDNGLKTKHLDIDKKISQIDLIPKETDYVTGACIFIKNHVIKKLGLMPEEYFLYFEETDYCINAKKENFKLMVIPSIEVLHHTRSEENNIPTIYFLYYFCKSALLFTKKYDKTIINSTINILLNKWSTLLDNIKKVSPNQFKLLKKAIDTGIEDGLKGIIGKINLEDRLND